MLFNSFEFAIFFATCFGLYLVLPHRAQNRMLLAASYVFYSAWDWRFLSLLVISTLVDYAVGRRLSRTTAPRVRRGLLSLSLIVNLGILGFFKYADFFADGFQDLLGLAGLAAPPFILDIVLPVGISFYTFQTLSYTIDIYRGRCQPTRNLFDFALFVAFFPQLVAGPIERATHLLPQIVQRRRVRWELVQSGSWLALWGLFKKVVIADNLSQVVDAVFLPGTSPTGPEVLVATYAFAVQIYCDFSGYTDIARGIARMMGFDIMLNFNLPYAATSPADFWRRWHISLSTWLRDYLYIPLGGNRGGRFRTYRNLTITMLLGGLWHGAAWPFVIWGAYHGAILAIHRALRPQLARIAPGGAVAGAAWRATRVLFTFHLVCLGWIIFRCETLGQAGTLLGTLLRNGDMGQVTLWIVPFAIVTLPLLLMELAQARAGDLEPVFRWSLPARTATYAIVFLMIVMFGGDGGQPFIYFRF